MPLAEKQPMTGKRPQRNKANVAETLLADKYSGYLRGLLPLWHWCSNATPTLRYRVLITKHAPICAARAQLWGFRSIAARRSYWGVDRLPRSSPIVFGGGSFQARREILHGSPLFRGWEKFLENYSPAAADFEWLYRAARCLSYWSRK